MESEDLANLFGFFVALIAGTAGHNITCSVPSVAAGQTTSLTCYFGRDISQERRDFVIHKYDLAYNYQGFALNCYWLDPFSKPLCQTMPGYDFNKQVNDSTTLHIQNAAENNVGIYACQVTPPEPEDLPQTCLFRLKETTAQVPVTSTVFPRNQGEADTRLLPALLVSLVCLVGVIAASVVLFKRRLRNHCCKSHTQTADQLEQILPQTIASTSTEVRLKEHLLRACRRNSIKEVKALLNSGAPVNCRDESRNGETPLHVACRCGSEALLELLLNKGADIEAKNKEGFTPLHTACKYGRKVAVERLIARDANINAAGEDALTPLHLACQYDHTDVLEQLLRAGANVEAKDINQMTPLHLARKTGSPALIEALMNGKADVNAKSQDGRTPLILACQEWENEKESKAEMVPDIEAADEARGKDGLIAQHAGSPNEAMVKLILSANPNTDDRDTAGMSALHWACKNGQQALVKILLAHGHGARVNSTDRMGRTPLHLACESGSKETVQTLYEYHADLNARTETDLRPKDVAKRHNHESIVSLLVKLEKGNTTSNRLED